jgi:hypothetical protein
MEPQEGREILQFRVTKRSTKLRRLSKTTRRSRVHVQTVGLNAETKKVSAPSRRRKMSLDIPFYRTVVQRAMRHASPETKRRYQLGMVEQVRQNLEKAN